MIIYDYIKKYGFVHFCHLALFWAGYYFKWFRKKVYKKVRRLFSCTNNKTASLGCMVLINQMLSEENYLDLKHNFSFFDSKQVVCLVESKFRSIIDNSVFQGIHVVFFDGRIIDDDVNEVEKYIDTENIMVIEPNHKIILKNLTSICTDLKRSNWDVLYTDNYRVDGKVSSVYKPDFSPEYLEEYNYIGNCYFVKRKVLSRLLNCASLYDFLIKSIGFRFCHVKDIVYYEKKSYYTLGNSFDTSSKYRLFNNPLITIIIPNRDHAIELSTCIDSIINKSSYENYEIIIIDNNSVQVETQACYYSLIQKDNRIRVEKWNDEFNYSAINNYGVSIANGEYIILLNNDVEVVSCDWIQHMLVYAQEQEIGAVGVKLLYYDNTIQHAGIVVGIGGVAGHSHKNFSNDDTGYEKRLICVHNVSAVTGACLMVKKEKYNLVGGLDEKLKVAFNDVDFSLKLQQRGFRNVVTPKACLYHYESKSRGLDNTYDKRKRFNSEIRYFKKKWKKVLRQGDKYYNENLTLLREDFSCGP